MYFLAPQISSRGMLSTSRCLNVYHQTWFWTLEIKQTTTWELMMFESPVATQLHDHFTLRKQKRYARKNVSLSMPAITGTTCDDRDRQIILIPTLSINNSKYLIDSSQLYMPNPYLSWLWTCYVCIHFTTALLSLRLICANHCICRDVI